MYHNYFNEYSETLPILNKSKYLENLKLKIFGVSKTIIFFTVSEFIFFILSALYYRSLNFFIFGLLDCIFIYSLKNYNIELIYLHLIYRGFYTYFDIISLIYSENFIYFLYYTFSYLADLYLIALIIKLSNLINKLPLKDLAEINNFSKPKYIKFIYY